MRILLLAVFLAGCEIAAGSPPRASSPPPPAPPPPVRGAPTDADAAWNRLKSGLDGHWRATVAENKTIRASYRPISKGSALVETFTSASGNETMTIIHRDGPALLLTHYCAQGNQARLKATETSAERIVFDFVGATNVGSEQSVMQRLVFQFRPDGFDQESTYKSSSGEVETTTLHFVRE